MEVFFSKDFERSFFKCFVAFFRGFVLRVGHPVGPSFRVCLGVFPIFLTKRYLTCFPSL